MGEDKIGLVHNNTLHTGERQNLQPDIESQQRIIGKKKRCQAYSGMHVCHDLARGANHNIRTVKQTEPAQTNTLNLIKVFVCDSMHTAACDQNHQMTHPQQTPRESRIA